MEIKLSSVTFMKVYFAKKTLAYSQVNNEVCQKIK